MQPLEWALETRLHARAIKCLLVVSLIRVTFLPQVERFLLAQLVGRAPVAIKANRYTPGTLD